jgi:hypothetical protein
MNRRLNMATTKKTIETTNDNKDKISIVEIIQDIDARLTHIEDIYLDNRDLIVKLVKQGNTVVEFLKDFQLEDIDPTDLEIGIGLPPLDGNEERISRTEGMKDLIDDILERQEGLKEFEKELKKHKGKITPGQVGEA